MTRTRRRLLYLVQVIVYTFSTPDIVKNSLAAITTKRISNRRHITTVAQIVTVDRKDIRIYSVNFR